MTVSTIQVEEYDYELIEQELNELGGELLGQVHMPRQERMLGTKQKFKILVPQDFPAGSSQKFYYMESPSSVIFVHSDIYTNLREAKI